MNDNTDRLDLDAFEGHTQRAFRRLLSSRPDGHAIVADDGQTIAHFYTMRRQWNGPAGQYPGRKEALANADLFVVAPRLSAELREARAENERLREAAGIARDVLVDLIGDVACSPANIDLSDAEEANVLLSDALSPAPQVADADA